MRRARSLPFGAVVVVAVAALVAAPAAGAKTKDGKLDPDKVTPVILSTAGPDQGPSSSRSRCG